MIIEVIAPCSPFDVDGFHAGVALLENRGFRVRHRGDVFAKDRFLAGDDERRAAELVAALESDADLLWCARGGYGATRLLERVPPRLVKQAGKKLVGFSDVTALHALWWQQKVASIHGPMIARLASESASTLERILDLITNRVAPMAGRGLRGGRAQGRLVGGNLALLAALCGTPWQPDFTDAIVFIEDIGERPYRLDRAFVQCEQAGLFRGIAGLAFGDFTDCDEPGGRVTASEVLHEHASILKVPAIEGLPCGHGHENQALLFGAEVLLDGDIGTLTWKY